MTCRAKPRLGLALCLLLVAASCGTEASFEPNEPRAEIRTEPAATAGAAPTRDTHSPSRGRSSRARRPGWVMLEPLPPPPRASEFGDAKRALERDVHDEAHRVEIYCGCHYDARKSVDFESCESAHPYVPVDDERERAARIEWDHILPASFIGQTFACWSEADERQSHREHCRDTSPDFARAEGDMHNLWPSVGQLNALRDNFPFAELPGEEHIAGCDFELRDRLVEPRPEARGLIARAVLYAAATYQVELNPRFYETVVSWDRAYPPSAWERERNDRIEALQGNRNPYVDGRGTLVPVAPR